MRLDQLTPDGDPPSRGARWCPSCRAWRTELHGRRRCLCGTAIVRQPFHSKPKAGELRPGVVAEFADPRDSDDPIWELEAMRARAPEGRPMTTYREHLRRRLFDCQIPVTLHSGLVEYFAARRPTGDFLKACLENNLREAITRADEDNRYAVTEIVLFLHHYVPSPPGWPRATRCPRCSSEGHHPADRLHQRPTEMTEGDRSEAIAWFQSKGFILDRGNWVIAWSQRSGIDFTGLEFYPLYRRDGDVGWDAIVGHHASGENPRLVIGRCETLAELQMVYETLRLINGYPSPEAHRERET